MIRVAMACFRGVLSPVQSSPVQGLKALALAPGTPDKPARFKTGKPADFPATGGGFQMRTFHMNIDARTGRIQRAAPCGE